MFGAWFFVPDLILEVPLSPENHTSFIVRAVLRKKSSRKLKIEIGHEMCSPGSDFDINLWNLQLPRRT